uniref:SUMO-activating enzyme subunit n=1 Tax=Elaeophora elaphi TaxID=1147741 RepID=A0A0R3RSQ4_9BILA
MTWQNEQFLEVLRCPVLVVGVGGIGCELLKNLALTGFSNIEIVNFYISYGDKCLNFYILWDDLDTIDVSNLNRQFLFRREHVGKPKAVIAAEAIRSIAPNVKIVCYHDSVLKEEYGVDFFQKFTVVLSALDNIGARNHINRLCLAARVPLIESGSSGYLGHATQKTYPGCTIRNTPSEHIHCIVWAKHLFNQLFGEPDDEDEVSPDLTDENLECPNISDKENGNSALNAERNDDDDPFMHDGSGGLSNRINTRKWAAENGYDPKILFRKFFHNDIKYLLSMTNLWKQRRKPFPLDWDNLPNEIASSSNKEPNAELWTVLQCKDEFKNAVSTLSKRVKDESVLSWDKDDEPAMRFVAASANLRAHIFSIPPRTLFDIKSMAGNIIPAIATTNAIVAGMIIFIKPKPNARGKILTEEVPCKPNQQCYVCSERREITLKLNVKMTTVQSLENKFLKGTLHMVAPDVMISLTGSIIISSEEGETVAISDRILEKVGVIHGCILECDDFLQRLELRIRIEHDSELKVDEFVITRDTDATAKNGQEVSEQGNKIKRSSSEATDECSPAKIRKNDGEINS